MGFPTSFFLRHPDYPPDEAGYPKKHHPAEGETPIRETNKQGTGHIAFLRVI